MTQPVAHGYPDWSRQVPAADVIFFNLPSSSRASPLNQGPYFVGATPALGFYGFASSAGIHVDITFYNDAAGTISLGSQSFELIAATGCNIALPVQGPYVQILITGATDPVTYQLKMWAAPSTGVYNGTAAQGNILISQAAIAVGAGATVNVDSIQLWPTEATWEASSSLATWTATLKGVFYTGTTQDIDFLNNTFTIVRRQVFLPYSIVRVSVTNNTAGAGTIGVRLVAAAKQVG